MALTLEADGFSVWLAAPGARSRGCQARISDGLLHVTAVRPAGDDLLPGVVHCRERASGAWRRTVDLPPWASYSTPEITGDRGMLRIRIPGQGRPPCPAAPPPGGHGFLAIDLVETASRFIVLADVPGSGPDDVQVRADDGWLDLTAWPGSFPAECTMLWDERARGRCARRVRLPDGGGALWLSTEVECGVLRVEIGKQCRGPAGVTGGGDACSAA
jgi:HSP20 family molecular chaperone IbpA